MCRLCRRRHSLLVWQNRRSGKGRLAPRGALYSCMHHTWASGVANHPPSLPARSSLFSCPSLLSCPRPCPSPSALPSRRPPSTSQPSLSLVSLRTRRPLSSTLTPTSRTTHSQLDSLDSLSLSSRRCSLSLLSLIATRTSSALSRRALSPLPHTTPCYAYAAIISFLFFYICVHIYII